MDWNGLQVFLAVVQSGSVRAAGERLQMGHATVARRIGSLETAMGTRLFDRLAAGYVLTPAGETLVPVAERVEAELLSAERKLAGSDRTLAGSIQLTLPDVVATHLLMPALASFKNTYPNIIVDAVTSYQTADLSRRESDVALRFVVSTPPEHLIGNKLADLAYCAYATPDYLAKHDLSDPTSAAWIGHGTAESFQRWIAGSPYPHLPTGALLHSQELQYRAALNGMGIADLLCFLGDADSRLVRVPKSKPSKQQTLWLLRHRDSRNTARLQVFAEFLQTTLQEKRSLIEGTTFVSAT